MTTTTAPQFALCYCTDGKHTEPDRESFRLDRAAVEEGVFYADSDMVFVHEVRAVTQVEEVPFVDVRAADYRENVRRMIADRAAQIATWAAGTNQLPDDVKGAA